MTTKPTPTPAPVIPESTETAFHSKYRPTTLDKVVGHPEVVSQLQSVVQTGKWPSAIALFGPPSVGKTTLAWALATTCFGKLSKGHPDFTEASGTDNKTIDEMRNLISISKLRPRFGQRRFIFLDEAQGVLSNPQAASALLTGLERPPKSTTWILGSMDPDKFTSSQTGRALLSRCIQFKLKEPSDKALKIQANRIIKGEKLTYIDEATRDLIIGSCGKEMRQLAHLLQAVSMYYDGQKEKPKSIPVETLTDIMAGAVSNDDAAAARFLAAVYLRKFIAAQTQVLAMKDTFSVINKCVNLNWFLLNDRVLKGQKHPAIWPSQTSILLKNQLAKTAPNLSMDHLSLMHSHLVKMKSQAMAFSLPETMLLSSFAHDMIALLKKLAPVEGAKE